MSGFWWAVCAAVVWGIVPFLEKAGLSGTKPLTGVFYRSLGVALGLIVLFPFFVKPDQVRSVDFRSSVLIMLGGFLASIVGQIFFYHGLKTGEVSRMVLIAGSYPFITFLLGVCFLHESFTLHKGLGGALILAGLWLLKS